MTHVFDVALWDIGAKHANLPVYKLLGGFRESLPAYASTVTYSSIEEFLDIADQALALGYPAIKLHAFGDAKKDALLGEKLRAHVGDDIPLMYDGSAGFDLEDAVYLGNALYDSGFAWYEEPMREFSVTAYKWLGQRVKIPLLLGEVTDGAHMSAGDFAATGVATSLRTSTFLRGGFTGAMRIAHLADAYHLRAEVHGMGLESAHLCMAIKNTTYYESLIWGNPMKREALVDAQGNRDNSTEYKGKLSDDQKDMIVWLNKKDGIPMSEIAEDFGISKSRVHQIIQEHSGLYDHDGRRCQRSRIRNPWQDAGSE
jgi:L-alanine-DL-glutamate epimerase-like enolase superfamily enzyme